MEQRVLNFDVEEKQKDDDGSPESARFVEVCDLPYYTEPEAFYEARMQKGIRIGELREFACDVFEKKNDVLTVSDLKFAFLWMCPLSVNLGGNDHKVTVKKIHGSFILSCDCPAWIFNLGGNRICKHTNYVDNLMKRG